MRRTPWSPLLAITLVAAVGYWALPRHSDDATEIGVERFADDLPARLQPMTAHRIPEVTEPEAATETRGAAQPRRKPDSSTKVTKAAAPTATIRGHVLNRMTGLPVEKAKLLLVQSGTVAKAVTAADGAFALETARTGTFPLRIQADDFLERASDVLSIAKGQTQSGLVFLLTPVTRVHGNVAKRTPGIEYGVTLESRTGKRLTAQVDPDSGAYEVQGIHAGDWFVRLTRTGDPSPAVRQVLKEWAQVDRSVPDVRLTAGASVRFDLDATKSRLQSVSGTVLLNGEAAKGYAVRLSRRSSRKPTVSTPVASRDAELRERILRTLLSTQTDERGTFRFDYVPLGEYTIRVRGGGRRRGPRHEQAVFVGSTSRPDITIRLENGSLRLRITEKQSGKPVTGARVGVVLASETAGRDPRTWRRMSTFTTTSTRRGAAEIRGLAIGEYTVFVAGRGIKPWRGRAFVGAGDTRKDIVVERGTGRATRRRRGRRR